MTPSSCWMAMASSTQATSWSAGDRFYFVGRRGGVINVGGLKVHPEEVEAVINRHPSVRLSRVRGRRNPITGMVVVAEVLLTPESTGQDAAGIKEEILSLCHRTLERFKVPMRTRVCTRSALDRRR